MAQINLGGLTPQQEHFAQLVASGDCSQANAYRQAYPASRKWKAESVHEKASHLAADVKVGARIESMRLAAAEKAGLRAVEVAREIRRIAFSDVSKIIDPVTGRVKLPHELDEDTRRAVSAFEIDDLGRIKYKFWDKNSALDKAMRHLGLYEKDHTQATAGLAALRDALVGAVVGPDPRAALPDDDEPSEDE